MPEFSGELIASEGANCKPSLAPRLQQHNARYLFAAQVAEGRTVLDVGCGIGDGSQLLALRGAERVIALDLSFGAVRQACHDFPHPHLNYVVASPEEFGFRCGFDLITCFELAEPVELEHRVLESIAGALKEDGLLIISKRRPIDNHESDAHARQRSLLDLSNHLARYFPHVEWFFASVTGKAPKEPNEVRSLHPPLELGHADDFVAVASRRPIERSLFHGELAGESDGYLRDFESKGAILRPSESDLKQKIALVTSQNNSQDGDELARLTTEVAWLREQAEAGNAVIQNLKTELTRANASLRRVQRRYRDDLSVLRSELGRFHTEAILAHSELEQSQAEVAHWREAALERDAHILAIRHSRTWRLTEPLRSVAAVVRGGPSGSVLHARALVSAEAASVAATTAGSKKERSNARKIALGRSYLDVLYVIGCHDGESKRYRVHNLIEGLSRLGLSAAGISHEDIPHLLQGSFTAKTVVLFRCAFDKHVDKLLKYCKRNKMETIFDVDDLVFEPESVSFVQVLKTFNDAERAHYMEGVQRYRKTLLACDRATCTTAFLAQRIEKLNKRVDVIPNSLNRDQLAIARKAPAREPDGSGEIRIGYFSGSNTHQVDFESCESALLVVMETYPEVRFVLGGILDLHPEWSRFSDRIERHPLLPPAKMLKLISTIDINLAPLEMGNPYAHCKSELKIFEAGIVKVPTIASAIESYSGAIDSGEDGFLAASPEEWLSAMEQLIQSRDLRLSMAERAKKRALSQFGNEVVAQQAERVYDLCTGETQLESIDQSANQRLKITWIIPKLIIGGGGHRNILRAAYYLEKFGHSLELYFTDSDLDAKQLTEAVRTHFYPLQCPMHRFEGSIQPTDVLFATHWTTVSAAMRCKDAAREIIYFVQDFEPAFAPMGTEYILAENTYRLGLYCITSGPWCERFLKKEFGSPADHFLFPLDRNIYYPRARSKKETNVVFFAKPEMPRRCFELGIMALEEFHRLRPDVEIILFGSQHVQSKPLPVPAPVRNLLRRVGNPGSPNVAPLPFPATVRSLLPGLDDLAKMYANADVGMAFSTTNPSLVPYEMMACGLPIVDLERPGNETNYAGRTDIAVLANPDPIAMAKRIRDLLENPEELSARAQRGLEFVQTLPSEEEMARRVEGLIFARMASKQQVFRTAVS